MTESARAVHVAADEGELFVAKGAQRRVKITAGQTEGHLIAAVGTYPAGVPYDLHIHHNTIESFFILEGSARFYVDGAIVEVEKGAFLSVPQGVVHGFVCTTANTRAFVTATPGQWDVEAVGPLPAEMLDP